MKKLLLPFLLILTTVAFSQQPFRYDTIRVSQDDTRNIHQNQQHRNTLQQRNQQRNQQRLDSSQSVANTGFDARNLRYGLNFSLNISDSYSLIRFAPQVGYQFSKHLMAGAGVSYYYSKRKYYYANSHSRDTRHSNSLGANLFGYLYPTSFLAISVRPEINYIWNSYKDDSSSTYKHDVLVPSVVVGAGIRLGQAHAMLYYDLVQDKDSPYTSGLFYGVSVYF